MPRKRRQLTHPGRARTGANNAFARMWADPATRPLMLENARNAAKRNGRPAGVPDGYTKTQITILREHAEEQAERIITAMAENDEDIDNSDVTPPSIAAEADILAGDEKAAARAALKEAIVLAILPGNKQTKMSAIRTVLEYTKAKPAATVNSNISAAEDFLRALAAKEE